MFKICRSREKDKKKGLGNKIDCWIKTLFIDKNEKNFLEDKIKIICANLQLISQKSGIQKIYITSSVNMNKSNDVIETISNNLKHFNIEVMSGESILYNEDSLKKCTEMDGVVFVEMRNQSLLDEIRKEVECCKKYGLENMGFVIVE